jgi:simple sugar transport system ATP-binding protein
LSGTWGFDLDPGRPVESLTVGERQKCAVLALVLRNARYLVLDEPSAVLSPEETGKLFELLRKLRSGGKGIVLISHKLEETLLLAGRVTVLRKGKSSAALEAGSISAGEISSMIFGGAPRTESSAGAETISGRKHQVSPEPDQISGEPILEVEGLAVEIPGRPLIRSVSFTLPRGTITGVAGIRASGLETLELAITGFLAPASGTIRLEGIPIEGKGPGKFRQAGAAYLCADRTGTALAMQLPLFDSLIIHAHRRAGLGLPGKAGIMNTAYLYEWAGDIMKQARVFRPPKTPAASFSGGMLQRLVLARELAEPVRLLVLAEPDWGLDAQGRELIAQRLKLFSRAGNSALLFSADIDELMSLSDAILVLRDGKISAQLGKDEFRKDLIGRAMVGAGHD